MGCYYQNFYPSDGYEVDFQSFGYIASGGLTFIVTLQVCVHACVLLFLCMYIWYVFVCLCVVIVVATRCVNSGFYFSHRLPWIPCIGLSSLT